MFRLGIGAVGEGQSYQGRLKLLISTRDEQGGLSPMPPGRGAAQHPAGGDPDGDGQVLRIRADLNLAQGEQHVAIAVRDEGTTTTSFLSRTFSVGAGTRPDGAAAAR